MVSSDWVVLRGGRRVWRSVEHILTDGGGGGVGGGWGGVLRRWHLQQAVCGVLQRYVVKLPATGTTGGVGWGGLHCRHTLNHTVTEQLRGNCNIKPSNLRRIILLINLADTDNTCVNSVLYILNKWKQYLIWAFYFLNTDAKPIKWDHSYVSSISLLKINTSAWCIHYIRKKCMYVCVSVCVCACVCVCVCVTNWNKHTETWHWLGHNQGHSNHSTMPSGDKCGSCFIIPQGNST